MLPSTPAIATYWERLGCQPSRSPEATARHGGDLLHQHEHRQDPDDQPPGEHRGPGSRLVDREQHQQGDEREHRDEQPEPGPRHPAEAAPDRRPDPGVGLRCQLPAAQPYHHLRHRADHVAAGGQAERQPEDRAPGVPGGGGNIAGLVALDRGGAGDVDGGQGRARKAQRPSWTASAGSPAPGGLPGCACRGRRR